MVIIIISFVILFIIFLAFSPKKNGSYTPAQNAAGITVVLFIAVPLIFFSFSYVSNSIEKSLAKKENKAYRLAQEKSRIAQDKAEEEAEKRAKVRATRDEMMRRPNYQLCARYADIAQIIQSKRNSGESTNIQKKYLSFIRAEDALPLILWMEHIHEQFKSNESPSSVRKNLLEACLPSLKEYALKITNN